MNAEADMLLLSVSLRVVASGRSGDVAALLDLERLDPRSASHTRRGQPSYRQSVNGMGTQSGEPEFQPIEGNSSSPQIVRRRRIARGKAISKRSFALFRTLALVFVVAVFGGIPLLWQDSASQKPAPFSIPPDAAARTNPVKPTPAGLAAARKIYGYDCAMCHGATGDGKGDMAPSLKTPMKNFLDPAALKDMSDGEIYYIIDKGKGEMPGDGDRAKPEQMWNMVILVRSFAKK